MGCAHTGGQSAFAETQIASHPDSLNLDCFPLFINSLGIVTKSLIKENPEPPLQTFDFKQKVIILPLPSLLPVARCRKVQK